MNPLEIVVVCLFLGLLVGTGYRIVAMWEKKKAGEPSGRARLVFFFVACLMLVCLVPLAVFEMLTIPVGASDLMVVVANMIGFALTYDLALSRWLGGIARGAGAGRGPGVHGLLSRITLWHHHQRGV
mgnify:CR=1 FL=1|jgi:hypothetical protein